MAHRMHLPIVVGNSYEISSLSLAISKGYGFRFNNLPSSFIRSSLDKFVRVLETCQVKLPLKRITLSAETCISAKHFQNIELSLFLTLYAVKHQNICTQFSHILFLGRVDLQGNILPLPYIDRWLIRAIERSNRIARTIADFEYSLLVGTVHLSEAISLRGLSN